MSGSYFDTAAATEAADAAACAASMAGTTARIAERQALSAAFIAEWGAGVVDGHTSVVLVPPFLAGE
jgi:hypothetical protein